MGVQRSEELPELGSSYADGNEWLGCEPAVTKAAARGTLVRSVRAMPIYRHTTKPRTCGSVRAARPHAEGACGHPIMIMISLRKVTHRSFWIISIRFLSAIGIRTSRNTFLGSLQDSKNFRTGDV